MRIVVGLLLILSVTCSTPLHYINVDVESLSFADRFANCTDHEAIGKLTFIRGGDAPRISGSSHFIVEGQDWRLRMLGPLANSLATFTYYADDKKLEVESRIAEFSKLSVDPESGFLHYNDYLIPFRPEELNCFLQFKFPEAWLDMVIQQQSHQLTLQDANRKIFIVQRDQQTCFQTRWSLYWRQYQVNACMKKDPHPKLFMKMGKRQISYEEQK